MNELLALKEKYLRGEISKYEYYSEIHGYHKNLYLYPALIAKSNLQKIEIDGSRVVFFLETLGETVKMVNHCDDFYATGLNCLNSGSVEHEYIEMLAEIMSVTNERFCLFDIGANLGYYSLALLKRFPDATAYAFEPIPDTFAYLMDNISLNGMEGRVKAVNIGLSDNDNDVLMYYNPSHSGTSSLKNIENVSNDNRREVKLMKLDSYASQMNQVIDLIKCDVEGAEKLVFEGGMDTLRKHYPVILCEMMRKWDKAFEYHPNDTIALLAQVGYQCYRVKNGVLELMPFMDEDVEEMNFLFLSEGRHADIIKAFAG